MATRTVVPEHTDADLNFETQADLSALQYHFVKLDTNGLVVACGANEKPLGILQNDPLGTSAAPATAVVRLWGASKLKADEAWAHGNFLTCTASSKGEVADAANEEYGAVAIGAAADGDLGAVVIFRGEVTASDA